MRRRLLACLSLTMVMVLGGELHANVANAGLNSVVNNGGVSSVSSGKWGAVAGLAPTNASTGSFSVTGVTRSTATTTGSYFTIRNVGTLQLISVPVSLTTTTTSGSNTYTANIHECLGGTWTESTGACVGGTITLVTFNTNAQSKTVTWVRTINPSTGIRLRLQYVSTGNRSLNATISLSVARANVRLATDTHS